MAHSSPVSQRTFLRRTFLGSAFAAIPTLSGWLSGALAASSAGRPDIGTALTGFRRTAVFSRRYSVHATVLMLGVPVLSRRDVGGGYASVELGSASGARAVGLQFAAGAWPQRAAGLNRFGVLKEAVIEGANQRPTSAFAGLISAIREASLKEAQKALHSSGPVVEITVTRGGSIEGRAWSQTQHLPTVAPRSWMEAEDLLRDLLRRDPTSPAQDHDAGGAAPFLETIRKAALCAEASFRREFFHASKRYVLDARWAEGSPRELCGVIRNAAGAKSAEFRTFYAPGDSSGLPIRIEYRPRSFLRLTFEAETRASHPGIPSLFPEVNE